MEADGQDNVRELDPFSFMEGSSVIQPLGGPERSLDPRYAFHTPYVDFRPGRVVFSIRFDGLRATHGELRVNINAFIPGSGRDAIFVTSSRLQLPDRAAAERGMSITITSVAGATYAAYGYCPEGTDARATGLTITAEQFVAAENSAQAQPLLPTRHGVTELAAPNRLIGDQQPSFAEPVSQSMTAEQLEEPVYQTWAAKLGRDLNDSDRWRHAFIAQALDRYGILRPGARGLGWGDTSRALAPIFKAAGCEAFLAAPGEAGSASGAWTALTCSPIDAEPASDGSEPGIVISLAEQAADERGFDFLWSIGSAGEGFAASNSASLLLEQMTVLRPAGYAIHLFDMAGPDGGTPQALPRMEIERLAVLLISRGFSVAQLNFVGTPAVTGDIPFAMVVRKD